MRSTVVLIPIDTYDQPRGDAAVREGIGEGLAAGAAQAQRAMDSDLTLDMSIGGEGFGARIE